MNHHRIHAAVEVVDSASEHVDSGLKVTRAIAASEAFRKYDWLRMAPVKNVSGNFRGMVVSKQWASAYHFTERALGPMEKITVLAGLAENMVRAHGEVEDIFKSNDSWDIKAARLSTQVSSVAIRTVGGVIPGSAHLLAMSIGGYCQIAGLMGVPGATKLDQKLKSYDAKVTSVFDQVTDGGNMYTFINTHLVF